MATTTRVLTANVNGTTYTSNANGALEALDTSHAGATAPTNEVSNGKLWLDTTTPATTVLAVYNNAAWDAILTQSGNSVIDGTLTVGSVLISNGANATGSNVGIGDGTLASATTGTSNTAVGTQSLTALLDGIRNTSVGDTSMASLTSGTSNTSMGWASMNNTVSGWGNVAVGASALQTNVDGDNNVSIGYQALYTNVSGNNNTASGYRALYTNTGSNNTAMGFGAMQLNGTGHSNASFGYQALYTNTYGWGNTATGRESMFSNISGANNTSSGYQALFNNTTGSGNVGAGFQALRSNTTGGNNHAFGQNSLYANVGGAGNVGMGYSALRLNTTGDNNVAIGHEAGWNLTTGDNNVVIGSGIRGTTGMSNTVIIGTGGTQRLVIGSEGNATFSGSVAATGGFVGVGTGYGTQATTTSGTAFDFTGVPAGVNKVTMVCSGVSLSGSDAGLIQLGTSGGIISTGYVGAGGTIVNTAANEVSSANGLVIRAQSAARNMNGSVVFTRMSSGGTLWAAQSVFADASGVYTSATAVDLGAELTQLRLTRTGTNTFDAGTANISWSY